MAVRCVLALSIACTLVQGALDLAFGSDDDLTTFVTRPEIRAPILDVEVYDREAVRSGKWFTEGWVGDTGFREVDLTTGAVLFEWWPAEHLALDESSGARDGLDGPPPKSWNWFHMNSVAKNPAGDYLVSARWTNTLPKISGRTGRTLWRPGGPRSSFVLEGFNFSRQHDARWLDHDDDDAAETLSVLDDAADPHSRTAHTSSVLLVRLDHTRRPPTATLLRRIWRPDGELSLQRGNAQRLAHSGHTLAGWSGNAYMTEHDEAGRVVLAARSRGERFVTYRSYKFDRTGAPSEPIAVESFAFGGEAAAVTVVYVSWNGATEVREWRFHGRAAGGGGREVMLGAKGKRGFETVFQTRGWFAQVWVEGVDGEGEGLGRSGWAGTVAPEEWSSGDAAGSRGAERGHKVELSTLPR